MQKELQKVHPLGKVQSGSVC